ncbi:MAG: 5-formyltetrahydrofolate cyclo-ligase [Phycisphaeraceae bacterium]|nr:5-formyltetrahydrofolate cyclo-ligase [Phycisphaeraceae bacterium]
MNGTPQDKRSVRTLVRERLAGADADRRRAWSSAICKRLIEWPATRDAACVMVYLPTREEAGVDCFISWRIKQGLTVCGPRVDWQTWDMTPMAIGDLRTGVEIRRHGIREPIAGAARISPGTIDVVLTPGVAFDEAGRRVGRGAGCYDRFLARNDLMEGILAVGVCFEAQVLDAVPADDHDVRVGAIVTEERIIWPMKR